MSNEKLFIITYDIANPKRWRKVFKVLNGYGEWLQLSVFQSQMSDLKKEVLISELEDIIHKTEDQILLICVGNKDKVKTKIVSLGKNFDEIDKKPMIF